MNEDTWTDEAIDGYLKGNFGIGCDEPDTEPYAEAQARFDAYMKAREVSA